MRSDEHVNVKGQNKKISYIGNAIAIGVGLALLRTDMVYNESVTGSLHVGGAYMAALAFFNGLDKALKRYSTDM